MDLLTIIITVLRRWWVVLPVLGLTAVAVVIVSSRALPEYEATGTLLLRTVQDSEQGVSTSRDGLITNSFVIAEVMNSGEIRAALADEGFPAEYEVTAETASGILRVVARGADAERLADTVVAVLERARQETLRRQPAAAQDIDPTDAFEMLSIPTGATVDAAYRLENPDATEDRYVARGSALITPLVVEQNAFQANTYTIRILVEAMGSRTVTDRLRDAGLRSSFVLDSVPRDPAPILYLTTSGSDPDDVLATYDRVEALLAERLAELQEDAGANPTTLIQAQRLAAPGRAVLLSTNRTRPAIALSGLGFIAAVSLALIVDGALQWRTRRTREVGPVKHVTVPPVPPVSPVRDHRGDRPSGEGPDDHPTSEMPLTSAR